MSNSIPPNPGQCDASTKQKTVTEKRRRKIRAQVIGWNSSVGLGVGVDNEGEDVEFF